MVIGVTVTPAPAVPLALRKTKFRKAILSDPPITSTDPLRESMQVKLVEFPQHTSSHTILILGFGLEEVSVRFFCGYFQVEYGKGESEEEADQDIGSSFQGSMICQCPVVLYATHILGFQAT